MLASMKIEKTRDLAYYEALPYSVVVRKDEDGDFVARIQELPGCIAHGETEASAIEHLRSMQRLWLEDALSSGDAVPEPEDDSTLPSGKWVQRVPRKLHRDLVRLALRENVSLNQLVTSMLSEALAVRSCTHAFQTFLSRVPQPAHLLTDSLSSLWWGSIERAHGADRWSTTRIQADDLIQRISRVKNLKHGSILLDTHFPLDTPYADEYTEAISSLQQGDGQYEEFLRGLELISVGLRGCSAHLDRAELYRLFSSERKPSRAFKDSYKVTELGTNFFEAAGLFVVKVQESSSAPPVLSIECEFEAHFHVVEPISRAFVKRFVDSEFQLVLVPYARQFVSSVTAGMSIPPLIIPLSTKSATGSKSVPSVAKKSKSKAKAR
jgi:antitoxin HicB